MTNIPKRIKALFFLRAIFLISFVAGLGSFLVEAIALSFGEGHVFSEAGGTTLIVFTIVFEILRLIVIVLVAATFILTLRVNKECAAATCTALVAAVFAIVSIIFQFTSNAVVPTRVFELVSGLALAASVFLLIDGIFDQKARKTPLFTFATLGICLMVISSVLTLLTYLIKATEGVVGAVYSASQVTYILFSVILFLAIHTCLKEVRNIKESEAI